MRADNLAEGLDWTGNPWATAPAFGWGTLREQGRVSDSGTLREQGRVSDSGTRSVDEPPAVDWGRTREAATVSDWEKIASTRNLASTIPQNICHRGSNTVAAAFRNPRNASTSFFHKQIISAQVRRPRKSTAQIPSDAKGATFRTRSHFLGLLCPGEQKKKD